MEPLVPRELDAYIEAHSSPEPGYLTQVARRTEEFSDDAGMLVGHLEGRFLKMLVAMIEPVHILEIGSFTGYSALAMAEALPEGGRIITLEVDPEHARIAREHIAATPYFDRIELREGHAMQSLAEITIEFDLVFIDADKGNYLRYYEAVLPLLSRQGFIAVDNVLWSGSVIDPADESEDTVAIRAFNEFVRNDERVECVMIPVRDGVTLIRKV